MRVTIRRWPKDAADHYKVVFNGTPLEALSVFRVAGELAEKGIVYAVEQDESGYAGIYMVWCSNLYFPGETLARLRRLIKERIEYYTRTHKYTDYYDLRSKTYKPAPR